MTRSKPTWSILLLTLVALACVAFPRPARADDCAMSCAAGKRVCESEMRTAFRACAQLCSDRSTRRTCGQQCRVRLIAARDLCRTALAGCRTDCPPPSTCAIGCARDLRTCLAGVPAQTCPQGCFTTARAAGKACATQPDRFRCLMDVGTQLASCLRGCVSSIHSGADACFAAAQTCRAGCPGGSPSGAFLN